MTKADPLSLAAAPPALLSGAGEPLIEAFARRPEIDEALRSVGGVLLRGYVVEDVGAFRAFAAAFGHELLSYEFGSTPRSAVEGKVYSSTEYPAHREIPLHGEQSYTREWPMLIWFHCVIASPEGGATPLADARAVYRAIDPSLREKFARRGLRYVRNFGNGLDVPWTQVFNTQDRAQVEAYCRAHAIGFEWKEDGELRTSQLCQAVAVHPKTGEDVWFNQAHLFHSSALEPEEREALVDAVGEDGLPRDVTFGDGGVIPDEDLAHVRAALEAEKLVFSWREGDVLMLDNMLTMHGREPYRGPRKVVVAMAEPHESQFASQSGGADRPA
ncbi:TauD/TfdA family dioxygenase [Methylocella sp.]|uniref:TauD/TfdA family dioxygenase n=1 Tax=Methylocella sp. TaxID=1978226 RepID=UPI0035B32FD6